MDEDLNRTEILNREATEQLAQRGWLIGRLVEMQLRMSVVAYDRRTIRRLIDEVEEGCPDMDEGWRAVLTAARRHLDLSEQVEDAEDQVRLANASSQESSGELQILLAQVYESWSQWQTAIRAV